MAVLIGKKAFRDIAYCRFIAMKRFMCLGIFCFWTSLVLFSQEREITGLLLDQQNGEPVPYAVIRLSGTGIGAISNQLGEFSLSLPIFSTPPYLEISCLGYEQLRVAVSSFSTGQQQVIRLKEQAFTLDAVFIYPVDLSPEQLVEQAFRNIRNNYPQEAYVLNTFYRHYCKEQGVYGRLIEGAVDLYDKSGYRKRKRNPGKKFGVRMKQLRRSIDFTSLSGFSHAPISLFTTLQKDVAGYKEYTSQLWDNQDDVSFSFRDTTYYQGKVVYVVRCEPRKRRRNYLYDLYISADDFAILRMEEQYSGSYYSKRRRVLRIERYVTTYQLYQGRYYLGHLLNEGSRTDTQLDSLGNVLHSSDHQHHVELMVNQIRTSGIQPFEGSEPTQEQMAAIPYDPKFWEGYTVLKATPLEQDIEQDLANRISLEKQFQGYNQQDKLIEIQDQLMSSKLDNLLDRYTGQPVLLCFWDSDYKPGLKEILFARKLAKEYADTKLSIGLVFLSLDRSEVAWSEAIRKYRLYAGHHIRLAKGAKASISQRYGVSGSPFFVLLDQDRKPIIQGAELPKRSTIDELVEELLE